MKAQHKKPIIGVLGGIGAGKSTVAREFGKLGCKVIDADSIAHELLEEENIKNKIVETFGDSILNDSGGIDRRKLAGVVFADSRQLEKLNSIIHGATMRRVEDLIEHYRSCERIKGIVLDIPLLAEVGWDRRCDYLVFVESDRHKRLGRAQSKLGLSEDEFRRREKFQISLDNKRKLADNVVVNNSDLASMVEQVSEIFSCMMGER